MNTPQPRTQANPDADDRSARPDRQSREREHLQELVDTEGEQSFPASDPPGWTLGLH